MGGVDQDFADFVAQNSPPLVTIARLMCGDCHLAEDLGQGGLAGATSRERLELPNGDLDGTWRQRAFLKAVASRSRRPRCGQPGASSTRHRDPIGKYVPVDSGMTNDVILSLCLSLVGITDAGQIQR